MNYQIGSYQYTWDPNCLDLIKAVQAKEGDTKPGKHGTLVLRRGRWRKLESTPLLPLLPTRQQLYSKQEYDQTYGSHYAHQIRRYERKRKDPQSQNHLIINNNQTYTQIAQAKGIHVAEEAWERYAKKMAHLNALTDTLAYMAALERQRIDPMDPEMVAYQALIPNHRDVPLSYWAQKNPESYGSLLKDHERKIKLDQLFALDNLISLGEEIITPFMVSKPLASQKSPDMERLLSHLLSTGIPEQDAKAKVARIPISNRVGETDRKVIERFAHVFCGLTLGYGIEQIQLFDCDTPRASADPSNGILNVGAFLQRSTLYHEMAHFIEFGSDRILQAAELWRDRKATGPPQLLGGTYRDDEIAVPGKFVDPYVGKIYQNGSTEVVSVGLQHFGSAKNMGILYHGDREHFVFMVGLLGALRRV